MAINILKAFEEEPPDLDFLWSGFLTGTVGALIAPGATGKSYWALQAAMAVACGTSGGDLLGLKPKYHGAVVYLAKEDPEIILTRRIHYLGQYLKPEARGAIADNLTLEPLLGKLLNIMDGDYLDELIETYKDTRLIILDTLTRFHTQSENDNSQMAHLITQLEHLAAKTGASVLFLHHTNKSSGLEGRSDQQAARGASSLIDNARWCGNLNKMSELEAPNLGISPDQRNFYVKFSISKQNYDTPFKDRWYKRHDNGVLLPVDLPANLHTNKNEVENGTRIRQEF